MRKITNTGSSIKVKVKRKGVHAKNKQSKNKNSTLYKKPYNRQGK